ncbi:MAG: transporter substrate-binding domain-containing protein [Candidatus Promineifilaceae bacterium]
MSKSRFTKSRYVGCVVFFVVVVLLLVGCRNQDDAWPRIQESGILRVGVDPTYPPFEEGDSGPLEGFDVDLARAIAADLGLEAQFTYFGYDGLYDALGTEQVDVLISALVVFPERTRDFAYSDSYFNAGQLLIAPESADLRTVESLDDHTLAVELGAEGHVLATTWERQLPQLTVMPYNSPDEAITAVLSGEADAVLIDSISGRLFLKNRPNDELTINFSLTPMTEEPFAFVTRIEDRDLLRMLNESLQRLKENGSLDIIDQRWLG